jgi:hypothetical protein
VPSGFRRSRLICRTIIRGWPREDSAIHPSETLLRAIPNTSDYFRADMGSWAVAPYAFTPNKKRDVDGMSFFREDFTTCRGVAEANRHPAKARTARITMPQLDELELEARPEPDTTELPGHSLVPDMRFVEKKTQSDQQRQRTKDRSQKLAQFATRNGVYTPTGLPDPVPPKQEGKSSH